MKRPLSHNATSLQSREAENALALGRGGEKTQGDLLEAKELLDHEFIQYNQRRNIDVSKS